MINRDKQGSDNSRESWARWRWLMYWAILALAPLTRLVPDCRGDPTNHHLPRSRPEGCDGSRYDSSAKRANYWWNDDGPENTEKATRKQLLKWLALWCPWVCMKEQATTVMSVLTWSSTFTEITRSATPRERREAHKAVIFSKSLRQITRYVRRWQFLSTELL